MDMELYQILTQPGMSARMPSGAQQLGAAIDEAALREAQLRLAAQERERAMSDDLANQGMFEQLLTQGTAFDAKPRELGTGALRDRRTLAGGGAPPATAPSGGPEVTAEGESANLPVLQSVFERMERKGETYQPVTRTVDGAIEISGANWVDDGPKKLEGSKLGQGRASKWAKEAPKYKPRQTEEGRKNAQALRSEAFKAGTAEERLKLTQEYKGREAELRAATQLTVTAMRESAALQRARLKGAGKGDDPRKWLEKGLRAAQSNLAAIQKHYDTLASSGFVNSPEAAQAREALQIAQEEAASWEGDYDKAVRGGGSTPGRAPQGRVPVRGPNGESGTMDAAEFEEASKHGWSRASGA